MIILMDSLSKILANQASQVIKAENCSVCNKSMNKQKTLKSRDLSD